jgi:hypothetical protein
MSKRFIHLSLFAAAFCFIASSCNNQSADDVNGKEDSGTIDLNSNVVSAENVFVYIPSPIQTASLLKEAGAKYNKDLLNDPTNVSRYSGTTARSLNLGVYGTDLAFAGMFDQHAETMLYMDCTGKLADALHVNSAFSNDTHDRLDRNMNNRDSVLSIITDSYWDCDAMFHENNQPQASALMLAGGWIEGLYLACKVAESTNSNDIRVRIAEQRSSLDKLIGLLDKQKNADVDAVSSQLKELQKIFDALPKKPDQPQKVSYDSASGEDVVGEDPVTPVSLNDLEFKQILDQVSAMRASVVNRS